MSRRYAWTQNPAKYGLGAWTQTPAQYGLGHGSDVGKVEFWTLTPRGDPCSLSFLTYLHTYLKHLNIYIYIYIYIHTERERERERERDLYMHVHVNALLWACTPLSMNVSACICMVYLYLFVCSNRTMIMPGVLDIHLESQGKVSQKSFLQQGQNG